MAKLLLTIYLLVCCVTACLATYACDSDDECQRLYSASFVECRDSRCHCKSGYREEEAGFILYCKSMIVAYVFAGIGGLVALVILIGIVFYLYVVCKARRLRSQAVSGPMS